MLGMAELTALRIAGEALAWAAIRQASITVTPAEMSASSAAENIAREWLLRAPPRTGTILPIAPSRERQARPKGALRSAMRRRKAAQRVMNVVSFCVIIR